MEKKRIIRLLSLFFIACMMSSMVQPILGVEWYDGGFLPMGHAFLSISVGDKTAQGCPATAWGEFVACIFVFPPTKWMAWLEWQRYEGGTWKTKIEQVVTVIWLPAPLCYLGTWRGQTYLGDGKWRCRITWLTDGIWHSCRRDSWEFSVPPVWDPIPPIYPPFP